MVSKLDYVPNLPWDIPGWIWDMITFGTSIYPKSEVRFGMYEIRIPVWDIPKLIWDIDSVWATTEHFTFLQLRNSFRGYDNYKYTKKMPCIACKM